MAYRGNNLLLMEQRRADIERAQRHQQMQGIQQAMMVGEDIRNRQFDRQRQQAELHGRLAQQLLKQREPFAQAPMEEAAKIGQMEAKAEQQKILKQQERERQQLEEGRRYQEGREDVGFKRAKELRRISRPRTGGGLGDILGNSIDAANSEVKQRARALENLLKIDTFGRKIGTPEQIKQAEQNLLAARGKLDELATTADMFKARKGGQALFSWLQSQGGEPGGRATQSTFEVVPPSIARQDVQPSPATAPPLEHITDPVARQHEQWKREDPVIIGIAQREKEQKLAQAKEEMSRQQKDDLDELYEEVDYGVMDAFGDEQIMDLAAQYVRGDAEVKSKIDRIVNAAITHPDNPLMARKNWENALGWSTLQLQKGQGGAPATPTATSRPGSMPAETTDSAIMRRAKELGHR